MTDPCVARAQRVGLERLWLVFGLTIVTLVAELVGAWLSGSLALLADAGHLVTDGAAVALTLFTAWLARRPPTAERTYGYLRWEILAALLNGAVLFAASLWIIFEALERFRTPEAVHGGILFIVAAGGLAANAIALLLLHRDRDGSLNLRGAYLHVLGDLLGSAGAMVAGLVIYWGGPVAADPVISIVLALLILVGAWRLVRESTEVLLEHVPRHISVEEVERRMLGVPGVTAVHDLHVWTVTSGMVAMSGHAVAPALPQHPVVLAALQEAVARTGISHATIQLEVDEHCPEPVRDASTGHGHHHAGHDRHDHAHHGHSH